jgi:hypothetical protein
MYRPIRLVNIFDSLSVRVAKWNFEAGSCGVC